MRLRARQLGGLKFRRQHPVGRFVVDFFCLEQGIVVELDGGQHAVQTEYDQRRSAFLSLRGYRVLRFWDNEVIENIDGVLQQILQTVNDKPHPNPLLKERGPFPRKTS